MFKLIKLMQSTVLVTGLVVGVIGMAGVTFDARATLVKISQESSAGLGDFDANVLGYLNPFSTALTTSAFYQLGSPTTASYDGDLNGGPLAISNTTQLFMLSASDGLSMVVVHDKDGDGSSGTAKETWTLAGDTASILVADDGTEITGGPSVFTTNFSWVSCCTDGFAIGSLDNDWTMIGGFDAFSGITSWQAVSSGDGPIALTLTSGRRVRLQTIPEPGTLGLFLVGLAWFARRRRMA